jgi:glycosyltransferase involved in cell wall biosynthesis
MQGQTSVVIPCYDSQDYLYEALASVREQTTPVREIVVVDDGSPTPIQAPPAWDGPPLKVVRTPNRKSAAARNHGVQLTSGELVAFLDADDLWLPGKVGSQELALASEPAAVACYTRCTEEPGFFAFGPYPPPDVPDNEFLKVLWYNNFFPPSSVVVRRAAFLTVGGFLDNLGTGAEDLELWVRLQSLGRFVQVARPLCRYRQHATQFTRNVYAKVMSNKLARRAVIERHADLLMAAGIPREKLWNAHRNAVHLVYYRRDFEAARRLLWDYWREHPRDFRTLTYALVTLLPSRIVASLRGKLAQPNGDSRPSDSDPEHARWRKTLAQISRDLIR